MLTLVRFAPVTRYVGRERVITNALVVARAVFLMTILTDNGRAALARAN